MNKNTKNKNRIISYFLPKYKLFLSNINRRKQILFYNMRPLIIFELIIKVLTGAFFMQAIWILFDWNLQLQNLNNITNENLFDFIFNPVFIILFIFTIIIFSMIAVFEISGTIFTFEVSRQKKKTCLKDIVVYSAKKSIKLLNPKNWALIFFTVIIFPVFNIGTSSYISQYIKVPSSVLENLLSSWVGDLILILIVIVLLVLFFRWTFIFQFYTLENLDFYNSAKKSSRITRGNRFKNIISLVAIQVIIFLANFLLNYLSITLSEFTFSMFGSQSMITSVLLAVITIVFLILYSIIIGFFMPISSWRITTLYYENKELSKDPIKSLNYKESKTKTLINSKLFIPVIVFLSIMLIVFSASFYVMSNINLDNQDNQSQKVKIIAYKNFSAQIPNYSIDSIELAKKQGASQVYEKIDITKDDVVIPNNEDVYIKDVDKFNNSMSSYTYNEINKLKENTKKNKFSDLLKDFLNKLLNKYIDKGKFDVDRENTYYNETIPTIEDLLYKSRNLEMHLFLDCSIISTMNKDKWEIFSEKLKVDNIYKNCNICSTNYEFIEYMKTKIPDIVCLHKLSVALGEFEDDANVDGYIVDIMSANKLQIDKFHKILKSVYVWNVKDKSMIDDLVSRGVDNIITSHVEEAVEKSNREGRPEYLDKIISKNWIKD